MERKQELQANSGLHIEYQRPISTNRLYSAIIDFFIAAILILLLVFGGNAIVKTTDFYKNNQGTIDNIKISSKLYGYDSSDSLQLVTSLYIISGDQSASIVKTNLTRVLEGNEFDTIKANKVGFFDFCYVMELENPADLKDFYKEHRDAYDKERLEVLNPVNGKQMFDYAYNEDGTIKYYDDIIYDLEGNQIAIDSRPVIIENGNGKMTEYIDNFYNPFIKRCPNSLIRIPSYFASTQNMSTIMLSILIPMPIILGIVLAYFVPGLFLRRGRKSIGKLLFKIGIIDKDGYSPKLGRYLLRCLLILLECVLFIPAVVSLTMLVFSKKMITLHDLILKMNVVETREHKIYFNGMDAFLDAQQPEKKPVEFKHRELKR